MLALFGWRLAARGSSSSGLGINAVGQLAAFRQREVPPATLRSLDGTLLSLPDMKGELVVLNFWGSWCVPCREEAPALERAARLTRETGVRFVGVNLWEPESDARQFIKEMGVTYSNVLDADGRLAVELGVTGIPETYFVSRDGDVVRRWIGPIDEQRLLDLISELIAIP
jgi:cytochrome c biogenesis protein CcmG/thiol:disulfide interchange protein DsbE